MITGVVIDGKGVAHDFVRKYADDIKRAANIMPYPGTLNVQLDEKPYLPGEGLYIRSDHGAPIVCHLCMIEAGDKDMMGAIILPEKTSHPDTIIEVIAEKNIRETLGLETGEEVTCTPLE